MSDQIPAEPPAPKKRRRRIIRILGIVAILTVVLIVTGPWIAAHTGIRDKAINAALASPSLKASSDDASFGWFSSPTIRGLSLKSSNDHLDVRVEEITAERSILELLASSPDVGAIKVGKVQVQLELPLNVQPREPGNRLEPTFTANVTDAALTQTSRVDGGRTPLPGLRSRASRDRRRDDGAVRLQAGRGVCDRAPTGQIRLQVL